MQTSSIDKRFLLVTVCYPVWRLLNGQAIKTWTVGLWWGQRFWPNHAGQTCVYHCCAWGILPLDHFCLSFGGLHCAESPLLPQCARTKLSSFYCLSTLDVTHVRKDTRTSAFFLQPKTARVWERNLCCAGAQRLSGESIWVVFMVGICPCFFFFVNWMCLCQHFYLFL